jgi:hypothetical protein
MRGCFFRPMAEKVSPPDALGHFAASCRETTEVFGIKAFKFSRVEKHNQGVVFCQGPGLKFFEWA